MEADATGLHSAGRKVAAEAISAGQIVAVDENGELVLADASGLTGALPNAAGMALNSAAVGQVVSFATQGVVTTDTDQVEQGKAYYVLPESPGVIGEMSDIAEGQIVTLIGFADTGSSIRLSIVNTGIARGA